MLYFRQIIVLAANLVTIRIVLNALGVMDYGIYSLIGGIVSMFNSVSATLAASSQRYFSFGIGQNDLEYLKKIFNVNLSVYLLIALVVLFFAETIGLWFVYYKIAIPGERIAVSRLIYQIALVSFLFQMISSLYTAVIIAHEDMSIFANISIAEMGLKLGIAFSLLYIKMDKLLLYGLLACAVAFINLLIYMILCKLRYSECKFYFYREKKLFKEIIAYTSWSFFGSISGIMKSQGIDILLNQYFSPVVVAAKNISYSVNNAVSSFSNNFGQAIRPQIIKKYAAGSHNEMISLVFQGIKGMYFLMYVFILPLILEMHMVLILWLKKPPEYAVVFSRLFVIDILFYLILNPLLTAVNATGNNRTYQMIFGFFSFLTFIGSWICLFLGFPPQYVMCVMIGFTIICFVVQVFIIKKEITYSIKLFIKNVLIPLFLVSTLSLIFPLLLHLVLRQSIVRLLLVVGVSVISVSALMYFIGFDKSERKFIKMLILSKLIKKNI